MSDKNFTVIKWFPKGSCNALWYGGEPHYKDGDILLRVHCAVTHNEFDSESEVQEGLLEGFQIINNKCFAEVWSLDGWHKQFPISELHPKTPEIKKQNYTIISWFDDSPVSVLLSNGYNWKVFDQTAQGEITKLYEKLGDLYATCENNGLKREVLASELTPERPMQYGAGHSPEWESFSMEVKSQEVTKHEQYWHDECMEARKKVAVLSQENKNLKANLETQNAEVERQRKKIASLERRVSAILYSIHP